METAQPPQTGRDHARANRTRRGRTRRWRLPGLVALIAGAGVLLLAGSGEAEVDPTHRFDIRVRGAVGDGLNPIAFEGQTFAQVQAALAAVAASGPTSTTTPGGQPLATLAIGPEGFADVNVDDAAIRVSDPAAGTYTMTFRGMTTDFFGEPAELLATARWRSDTATDPELSLFFRYDDVELVTFEPFVQVDVSFAEAWIAVSRNAGPDLKVVPGHFPADQDYFDDGIDGTDDTFSVATTFLPLPDVLPPDANMSESVNFRGVLDPTGLIADVADEIGLSRQIRIDGTLSQQAMYLETCPVAANGSFDCKSTVSGSRAKSALGLELTAHLQSGSSSPQPPGFELHPGWILGLSGDTIGNIGVNVEGRGRFDLAGNPVEVGGVLSLSRSATQGIVIGDFRLYLVDPDDLVAGASTYVKDAYVGIGLTRVARPTSATTSTVATSTTVAGPPNATQGRVTLGATLDRQAVFGADKPGEVKVQGSFFAGTSGYGFELSGADTETPTVAQIAAATVGDAAGDLDPGPLQAGIDDIGVALSYRSVGFVSSTPSSTTSTTTPPSGKTGRLDLTFTGRLQLTLNSNVLESDILVIASIPVPPTELPDLLVVAKPSSVPAAGFPLSKITGTPTPMDPVLNDFFFSFATRPWQENPQFFNEAVKAFVETQTGPLRDKLFYREGLNIKAKVTVPDVVAPLLAIFGIVSDNKVGLSVALPTPGNPTGGVELAFPKSSKKGQFENVQLSLVAGRYWVDPQQGSSKIQTQFGLKASGDLLVRRMATPACDDATDQDADPSCFDTLTFNGGVGLIFGPHETTISGRLELLFKSPDAAASSAWIDPFGLEGLSLHSLALLLEVTFPKTSPVAFNVGIGANFELGDTSHTFSALLQITPGVPPFVRPIGFTFGAERLGLEQLVDLHNMVAPNDIDFGSLNLPDVRLESVFVSYGAVDERLLCIRTGFFLAAELHVGGVHGGFEPRCDGNGNLPPSNLPEPSQACAASSSCLASVLIDVQLGTTVSSALSSKVVAQGYFAGAELGPLVFDPTIIDLQLSAAEHKFEMSGGGRIMDLTGGTLAEGSYWLRFTGSKITLRGDVSFFDNGLEAGVYGEADLDFHDPQFQLQFYFRAPALEKLVRDVGQAFADVGQAVVDLGDAAVDAIETGVDEAIEWFESIGKKKERYNPLEGMSASEILEYIKTYDQVIAEVSKGFVASGLPPITISARERWRGVLHGVDLEIPKSPGYRLPNGKCVLVEIDGECWLSFEPVTIFSVPGICDDERYASDPACRPEATPGEVLTEVVGSAFAGAVVRDTGLDFGQIGKSPIEVLQSLHSQIGQGQAAATCARTAIDYAAQSFDDVSVRLDVDGTSAAFAVPLDLTAADFDPTQQVFQRGIEALVNGGDDVTCDASTAAVPPPSLAIEFRSGNEPSAPAVNRIDEGKSVWAHGTAPGGSDVTVSWGDGSEPTTVVASEDGAFVAQHRFVESGAYRVEATAGGASTAALLRVSNVAPGLIVTSPSSAAEGETVSLWAVVTDAGGFDTHTVTVFWGDHTSDTVELPGTGGGTVRLLHTYADEGASGLASVLKSIRVVAEDDDGASTTKSADITLSNVAPTIDLRAPTSAAEGEATTWELTLTDPGLSDLVVVSVDWGDGAVEEVRLDPATASQRVVSLTHTWADDDPTGTPQDTYTVKVTADDGDTGTAAAEATIAVANVAPAVAIEPVATAVDEASPLQWALTVDDPGRPDTHVVVVDWGDGTSEQIELGPPADGSTVRTALLTHTWADDDPTGTPEDTYVVTASAVDDDTGTGEASAAVVVRNVAPTFTELALSTARMAENEGVVTLDVAFADPGLRDSHNLTVDWGDGWSEGTVAETDVSGQDVRSTVVHVAAPGDAATAAATRARTLHNRYGDDGTYVITVSLVDDDTGEVVASRTLTVDSVTPEHAIDRSAATSTAGGPTWILQTGEPLTLSDSATDPGSEDLQFDWDFGDGSTALAWWLRATGAFGERSEADADGRPSPQVAPAAATSVVEHAWGRACLYGVATTVADDDGDSAPAEYGAVAVQRAPDGTGPRNFAQWRSLIERGEISQDDLDCYLDVAGHLSSVLLGRSELDGGAAGGDPTPWSQAVGSVDATARVGGGVPAVLERDPQRQSGKLAQEQVKFDRALLAVWLSYADGAFAWDQAVEGGRSFGSVLAELEEVRRTATDFKDVMDAWQRLNALAPA